MAGEEQEVGAVEAGDAEVKARNIGWLPKEEYKGDESKWVDASTFLEKGEHVLPILKSNNARLHAEVGKRDAVIVQLNERMKASEEAIEALKEFHDTSTKKAVEDARKGLLAQLKQAKVDRDVDAEVELTDELSRLNTAEAEAKAGAKPDGKNKGSAEEQSVDYTKAPWWQAWALENPWFGKDMRKSSLAHGVIQELLQAPETAHLRGKALLDKVSEEVDKTLGTGARTRTDKVEGSRTSGGGRTSGGKGFSDLPKEAKETCDRQGTKMVGDGRAFKTKADWQTYYAKEFFRGEES